MSATSVLVSWDRSPLPLEELTGYRVDYREVVQARKRQPQCTDEGFRNFSSEATSGEIDGLRTGVNYQFQVTALAVRLDGTLTEGDASEESDNTMAVPAGQGKHCSITLTSHILYTVVCQCDDLLNPGTTEEEEDDGDYSTGELVGAVVATFFITLLVHTVIMVIVFVGVLKFQRKRYCQVCVGEPLKAMHGQLFPHLPFRGYGVEAQAP